MKRFSVLGAVGAARSSRTNIHANRLSGHTFRAPCKRRLSANHEESYIMLGDKQKPPHPQSVPFETDLSKANLPAVDLQSGSTGATTYIMPKRPTRVQLRRHLLTCAIPMVGFGFMDNLIMIQAGDMIDNTICVALGFSTLTAAALGQIVSDVSGVTFGGVLEAMFARLGLPAANLTPHQEQLPFVRMLSTGSAALGVVVGCLLGMTSLFALDLQKAERAKLQGELQTLFDTIMHESAQISSTMHCSLWILESDGKHLWSRAHQGEVPTEEELRTAWAAIAGENDTTHENPEAIHRLIDFRVEEVNSGGQRVPVTALSEPLLELGYHFSESEMESLLKRIACHDGLLDFSQYSALMTEIVWREERHLPVDSSPILRQVVQSKRMVNIADAHKSDKFNPDLERYSGYKLQSVLAGPIISKDGRVLGVIELINKKAPQGSSVSESAEATASAASDCTIIPFSYDDERVLRLQCAHAASFIEQGAD